MGKRHFSSSVCESNWDQTRQFLCREENWRGRRKNPGAGRRKREKSLPYVWLGGLKWAPPTALRSNCCWQCKITASPTGKAACRLTLSILLLFAFYGIYVAPTFRDFVTFLCLANEWPYRKKKKKKEKKERKKGIRKFRIPWTAEQNKFNPSEGKDNTFLSLITQNVAKPNHGF